MQIVWEPILKTDVAAPLSSALGLIQDPRARQYWDPDLLVSADLVRAANEDPARYGLEEPFPPDFIAWDLVAVFDAAARWESHPPVPVYYGGPVAAVLEETRKALGGRTSR